MDYREKTWNKLELHRSNAATYALNILILGPTDDGTIEHATRCSVRDELLKLGHDAQFGEDLHGQKNALPNPVDDLILQVDSADLIIMIYKSRGTQTERDMLLSNDYFARKAIIFIEDSLYETVSKSVSGEDWKLMEKAAHIIKYKVSELPDVIINEASQKTDILRKQAYARLIRNKGIF
jgi:hypothetical protein